MFRRLTPSARQLVKVCDVRDFQDEELLETVRDILPERDPTTHVERKVWEFAMLALFLRDVGGLGDQTEALGVGAGNERILHWLANRVGRVVATDVYGSGAFAENEAQDRMLTEPEAFAPFEYRRDRLEVQRMDARRLDLPDASFDFVFSLSSIEHFGSPAEIAAAAAEIGRVLRPGGHAFLATELLVRRHPLDAAPFDLLKRIVSGGTKCRTATLRRRAWLGEMFTERELHRLIVAPSGLRLVQPLDTSLSEQSWANLTRVNSDATLEPATGEYFPHVLLTFRRSAFTSVALALEKPR